MDTFKALTQSKRFWAILASVLTVVLKETLGLDEATANSIALGLLAFAGIDTVRPLLPK